MHDDDPIKKLSGSGITVGSHTLEEYIDITEEREDIERASKLLKEELSKYSPKRTDKRQRGAKQRYYFKKPVKIFSKRVIYAEYKGVILMELVKGKEPLSKLIIQCLLDGEQKGIAEISKEILSNTNLTPQSVNWGSISASLNKIRNSELGNFILSENGEEGIPLSVKMHDDAINVTISDAYKLFTGEEGKKEFLKKYPELEPKDAKKKGVWVTLGHAIIEIMLSDCMHHTTETLSRDIEKIYGKKVTRLDISHQMTKFFESDLKILMTEGKIGAREKWFSFVFDKENNISADTLMQLYRKKGKVTIESLRETHPGVYRDIFGDKAMEKATLSKRDKGKVSLDRLRDSLLQKYTDQKRDIAIVIFDILEEVLESLQ